MIHIYQQPMLCQYTFPLMIVYIIYIMMCVFCLFICNIYIYIIIYIYCICKTHLGITNKYKPIAVYPNRPPLELNLLSACQAANRDLVIAEMDYRRFTQYPILEARLKSKDDNPTPGTCQKVITHHHGTLHCLGLCKGSIMGRIRDKPFGQSDITSDQILLVRLTSNY